MLTFVASGLDIIGRVLSFFEGNANLHCYTSCTLTTLHCSKVSFVQCCHMKIYNKIFTKMKRGVLTSARYCMTYILQMKSSRLVYHIFLFILLETFYIREMQSIYFQLLLSNKISFDYINLFLYLFYNLLSERYVSICKFHKSNEPYHYTLDDQQNKMSLKLFKCMLINIWQ